MADQAVPLSQNIIRNLSDKLYEKRKQAALDIEIVVRELHSHREKERIENIINYIVTNFTQSSNQNFRKGGLIALAAIGIGLGTDCHKVMRILLMPVLKCFNDQDSGVRYYACESLYNIAKVARNKVLPYFNEIFDGLCKLVADPEDNVRSGTQFLVRLMEDIVTENDKIDIDRFIPLLKQRIDGIQNPHVRQFLLKWISIMNSVPDIDLIEHLPKFLSGLFDMLSDKKKEIRDDVERTIAEFLCEIVKGSPSVDFGAMVKILLPFCSSVDIPQRSTALTWLNEFIIFGKEKLLPYSAELLGGILPCLSHDPVVIQEQSARTNLSLAELIKTTHESFPIKNILDAVIGQFMNPYVPTRAAALKWILVLHRKCPDDLEFFLDDLFPTLLKTLSDLADEVVLLDLEVMAKISSKEAHFEKLMNSLITLFSTDRALLENRGSLILRQLSFFINSEKIYRTLAQILENEQDTEFSSLMVTTLNIILLTSSEFYDLRTSLETLDTPESRDLFTVLYRSWCHNPASTFSLCLLAQAYEHNTDLIFKFAELEVTVPFLVEIDKLVQLIESPVFTTLRLQLLEPARYPYLFKCLYGLLCLLPQSQAFETLKNRLNSVSTLGVLNIIPKTRPSKKQEEPTLEETLCHQGVDFDELLKHFVKVQKRHSAFQRKSALQYNR